MNHELVKMWKEMVMAYFKVLSQNLPAGTERNHDKPRVITLWAENQSLDLLNINQEC
jgi:hypothetical protein